MKHLKITVILILFGGVLFGQDYYNTHLKDSLQPWQKEIAVKEKKDIVDYYLLLPEYFLEHDSKGSYVDSKEWRLKSSWDGSLKINRENGYLESQKDAWIKIALFKDTINHRDIIGFVKNGCCPPVQAWCEYGFIEFDEVNQNWNDLYDIFPWGYVYSKCEEQIEKLKRKMEKQLERPLSDEELVDYYSIPVIVLPEYGTIVKVVDDCIPDVILGIVKWNGQKFETQ